MYQSPVPLIVVAAALFCGITLFRSFFPEKKRRWQFAVPILVVLAAFGIDYLVETDTEQIEARINQAKQAVLDQKPNVLIDMLDDEYEGQYNYDKRAIAQKSRRYFSDPFAKKIRINHIEITPQEDTATCRLNATVHFHENSSAGQYFSLALVEARIEFVRRAESWLVKSVEIEEINNKPPPRW